MTHLLTILGIIVLLSSVAGIVFGGFMALDPKIRGAGVIFALWWISGVVTALGILVRDPATFAIGLFCFSVAGLTLIVDEPKPRKSAFRHSAWNASTEESSQESEIDEPGDEQADEQKEVAEQEDIADHSQTQPPNPVPGNAIISDEDVPEEDDSEETDGER